MGVRQIGAGSASSLKRTRSLPALSPRNTVNGASIETVNNHLNGLARQYDARLRMRVLQEDGVESQMQELQFHAGDPELAHNRFGPLTQKFRTRSG
jgi:hypothetical protein